MNTALNEQYWAAKLPSAQLRPLCKRRAKDPGCALGWNAAAGSCFFAQQDLQRTFSQAAGDCALLQGGLAELVTPAKAAAVKADVLWDSLDTAFYVGATRDDSASGGFRWSVSGLPLGAAPGWPEWMQEQPTNFGGQQDNLVLAKSAVAPFDGLADVNGQVDHRSYLCEAPSGTGQAFNLALLPPPAQAAAWPLPDPCPPGWTAHGVHCYQALHFASPMSFPSAVSACEALASNTSVAAVPGTMSDIFQRSLYLSLPGSSGADKLWTGVVFNPSLDEWENINGEPYDTVSPLTETNPGMPAVLRFRDDLDMDNTPEYVVVTSPTATAEGVVCSRLQDSDPACPRGWRSAPDGQCYMLGLHTLFQTEGESHCSALGGGLLDVQSALQQSVAMQMLSPISITGIAGAAWVAPVSGASGPRYGAIGGDGQPRFANFTLVDDGGSPLAWSSWAAYFPDNAVFTEPARVQLNSNSGRFTAQRYPAQAKGPYLCTAAPGAAQAWRPPPALTGGTTTTATTGTSSDTTVDDSTSLQALGYIENVYRQDNPCLAGWVPYNAHCLKRVAPVPGMNATSAQAACAGLNSNAKLAAIGTVDENEVVAAIAALQPGERAWIGCGVADDLAKPNFGTLYLSDGSPAKETFWSAAYDPEDFVPGAKCYMEPVGAVGEWGLSPDGAAGPSDMYGAVCGMRAVAQTPSGHVACASGFGLGWRYIKDENDSPGYCVAVIPQRHDAAGAQEACAALGATLGDITDAVQNGKVHKFLHHPLPSAVETHWIGAVRPTIIPGSPQCHWVNAHSGQALAYTNWEVPDPFGSTCQASQYVAFMRTSKQWGADDSSAFTRGAFCRLTTDDDFLTMFTDNPYGMAAFIPPTAANQMLVQALSSPSIPLPPGASPCIAFGGFSSQVLFIILTARDGQGWAPGWTATLNDANGASHTLEHPRTGYFTQRFMCVALAPAFCPTITVSGGAPGTGGNIVVTVYYTGQQALDGQLVAHAEGDNAVAHLAIPLRTGCGPSPAPSLPPSATPTPSGSSHATPSSSTSPSGSPSTTMTPSHTASATGSSAVTPSPSLPSPSGSASPTTSSPPQTVTPTASALPTPSGAPSRSPAASPSPQATVSTTPQRTSSPAPASASASPSTSTGTTTAGNGGGGGDGQGGTSSGTGTDDVGASGNANGGAEASGSGSNGDTGVVVGVVITVAAVVVVAAVYWYRSSNKDSVTTSDGDKIAYTSGGKSVGTATIVHTMPLPPTAQGSTSTQNPLAQARDSRMQRMAQAQAAQHMPPPAPVTYPAPTAYAPPMDPSTAQPPHRKSSWI